MGESEAFNERLVIELQWFWEHLKAVVCVVGVSYLLRGRTLLSSPGTLGGQWVLWGLRTRRRPFGGDRRLWLVALRVAGHCCRYRNTKWKLSFSTCFSSRAALRYSTLCSEQTPKNIQFLHPAQSDASLDLPRFKASWLLLRYTGTQIAFVNCA